MNYFVNLNQHNYTEKEKDFANQFNLQDIVSNALLFREINTVEKAERFLYPKMNDLYDCELLPDIDKAKKRIFDAIEKNENICIFGDYDTDGICASVIIYKTLEKLGANVSCKIPSRHEDGYGLNSKFIKEFLEREIKLVITVDNGITALNEVSDYKNAGIDVIVTDHHIVGDKLPDAYAVVAATRTDSEYPYKYLCGAGVSYKLSQALLGTYPDNELLGLAAIATIADIVPLTDENRTIVKLGFPWIHLNRGIKSILDNVSLSDNLTYSTVTYAVSPRINASGRMGDAYRAFELLISDDTKKIEELTYSLEKDNNNRKTDEQIVLQHISEMYSEEELKSKPAIIIYNPNWNNGILGIVASKLTEKYYKPVILITESKGVLVGSGRSTEQINLHKTLSIFSNYFLKFGGHSRAVGITIEKENLNRFIEQYIEYLYNSFDYRSFIPTYYYEQDITVKDITSSLIDSLELLAPFGDSNPRPLFCLKNVKLDSVKRIGKTGAHLDAFVTDENCRLRMVSFKNGEMEEELKADGYFDLLCNLQNNSFRGQVNPELIMIAFNEGRNHNSDNYLQLINEITEELLYNYQVNKEKILSLIRRLKNEPEFEKDKYSLNKMRNAYVKLNNDTCKSSDRIIPYDYINPDNVIEFCIFYDLGFVKTYRKNFSFYLDKSAVSNSLSNSDLYNELIGG